MIRRLLFAAAACAAIPLILRPQPAHSVTASPARSIQLPHIAVEVTGLGSPVILVPGLSSPRAVWDGIAPELAKTHRVYLVQVNGFGGSDKPGDNVRPGVLAGVVEDIHALIVEEKLGKPLLIGHSMGGLAGMMLAKAHPDDLAKLMVVDALPWSGLLFGPNLTVAQVSPQAAAMRDRMIASYGKVPDKAQADATAAALALKPDSRLKVSAWSRASDPRVTGLAFYDDLTTDLRADMAAIRTPITLVYPWSAAMPKERADGFYHAAFATTPNITYVPIADSAHFIMLDQPAAFAEVVGAFVK